MRGPGIEPGSTAWKAAMLTITPATQGYELPAAKCIMRGSNPRGLRPLGLKSSALTTRPIIHDCVDGKPAGKKNAPRERLELSTYRLTAGRAADCAIQEPL